LPITRREFLGRAALLPAAAVEHILVANPARALTPRVRAA